MKSLIDEYIKNWIIEIDNSKENIDLLRQTYIYWKENSDYESTWTWALIEKDWVVLVYWTNKLPKWIKLEWKVQKWTPEEKILTHAERDAIYNAARSWIKLEWTNIYMPWIPCIDCSIWIIDSWIKKLVMHYSRVIKTPLDRVEKYKKSLDLLKKSDIKLIIVNDEIWWCETKSRWEIWNP